MPSISLQGRVNADIWQQIKQDDETVTSALQRVTELYVAVDGEALEAIASHPAAAIAILLNSNRQLEALLSRAAIALPDSLPSAQPITAPPEDIAIQSAEEW